MLNRDVPQLPSQYLRNWQGPSHSEMAKDCVQGMSAMLWALVTTPLGFCVVLGSVVMVVAQFAFFTALLGMAAKYLGLL